MIATDVILLGDAYVSNSFGLLNTNYGSDSVWYIGTFASMKGVITNRSVGQVDLTGIASGRFVVSAELMLYITEVNGTGSGRTVRAHRTDYRAEATPWVELEITWNNKTATITWGAPGGDYLAQIVGSKGAPEVADVGTWWTFDVTAGVNAERAAGGSTLDLILKLAAETTPDYWVGFASIDHATVAFRPYLRVVSYVPMPGPDGLQLLEGVVNGGDLQDLSEIKQTHTMGTIPGVVPLLAGARNGAGSAFLRCDGGSRLRFKAPASTKYGQPVSAPSDGVYLLRDGEDGDKFLRVQVHADHLPATAAAGRVLLGDVHNNGIGSDDVDAAEASAGDVEIFSLTVFNQSRFTMHRLRVWIVENLAGLELSLDQASWYKPDSETHVDVVEIAETLGCGEYEELYVRRTIAAGSLPDPGVVNALRFAFDGL